MTIIRQYHVVCDHPDCSRSTLIFADEHHHPNREARATAEQAGWQYDAGQDLCQEHRRDNRHRPA